MPFARLLFLVVSLSILLTVQPLQAKSSDTPISVAVGARPAIGSDSAGHLHLLFEGGREGESHLYYLQSDDQGTIWSSPVDITPDQCSAQFGAIAVGKGLAIDIVWNGVRKGSGKDRPSICFARSSDGGFTFTKARTIFDSSCKSSGPSIALAPDGTINVVWCEWNGTSGDKEIYYSCSTDNGATWLAKQSLALASRKESLVVSTQPTVAVSDDGTVHVSWVDVDQGKDVPDIFYTKFENGKWTKAVNVSKTNRISKQPVIAAGRDKKVYLTWLDNSRKELAPDIWCAVNRHDAGFSPPVNISDTPGVSSDPAIATDTRGRVVIAWADTTSGANKPDIFGRISLDNLADFSNLIDFSNTEGRSKRPSVTIAGDRVYVVWEEDVGTGSEILMKSKSLVGVATGPTPLVDQEIHGASSNSR